MENPTVIYPKNFDVDAAWKECSDWVDEKGAGSIAAAFGSDPGCCHCPVCCQDYWSWGQVVQCNCGFIFPTDWWSQYSAGVNSGRKFMASGQKSWLMEQRRANPYFKEGFDTPPESNAWTAKDNIDWQSIATVPVESLLPVSDWNCKRCGRVKEVDRRNRTASLCIKCESETECKHRCSMMEKCCKAGVVFEELRNRRSDGKSLPCYYIEGMEPINCASFESVTVEEAKQKDEKIEAAVARMLATVPLISEVKKDHKGKDWAGQKPCPICSGVLHMSVLAAIVLLCFAGCESTPKRQWRMSLVRPDGVVHATYTVRSRTEPRVGTRWGGQTVVGTDSGNGFESTGLIAPTGWLWESEQIRDPEQ